VLCIGWLVALAEEADDGEIGAGGTIRGGRIRGCACDESRGQAVFSALK
jgi:hypothetical protein